MNQFGYLKFSAKGTKREVFGMPIPNELITDDIRENEPRIGDEEADLQKALEESLKDVYSVRQGSLPPVVIREPESGKFQPLPEVPGKRKDKVSEEQAAQVLLNLQTPKKKSPAEQYIFQRRSPAATEHSGHEESSSLYAELGLSDSDMESDEEMPPVVTSGAQYKGQTGPNPRIQDEGQAGPNPGDDAVPQPQSTPVVHAGPNLEHTDVEATDASNRPHPEQMDEGFIATAYPKVQENLKLTVEEPVIPEEPASSTRTLSSL
ncbi:monodehydroascorbate reductase [Tanacetum coccineum]